jgi:hypothetical protein
MPFYKGRDVFHFTLSSSTDHHSDPDFLQNGGTNCPACRGLSTVVTPSRPLESIIAILLRAYPSKTRAEGERVQADEIYRAGSAMRVSRPFLPARHTLPRSLVPSCPHPGKLPQNLI